MRQSILLGAFLAGCLGLASIAEARERHGHHGRHGGHGHGQQFAQPSSLRLFGQPHQARRFGPRHEGHRVDHRRPAQRFMESPPVPLSRQPGFRVLSGRQILPSVGIPVATPVRPFVARPGHRFPTYVRVSPSPGWSRHDGSGIPQRSRGMTVMVRDPGAARPW